MTWEIGVDDVVVAVGMPCWGTVAVAAVGILRWGMTAVCDAAAAADAVGNVEPQRCRVPLVWGTLDNILAVVVVSAVVDLIVRRVNT